MESKRGFLRAAFFLIGVSFIINLGFSALSPVFPYIVLAFKGLLTELPELVEGSIAAHEGAVEMGVLTAVYMVSRAPTAGVIGFFSDVLGKKKTMLLGMGLYLLASVGFIYLNTFLIFTFFRALQGMASAMIWPVAEAYLSDITPQWSRGRMISLYASSMLVAQIFDPSIGVGIYKLYVLFFGGSDVLLAVKSPAIFLALSCFLSLTLFAVSSIY